jgi:hypothetical protein
MSELESFEESEIIRRINVMIGELHMAARKIGRDPKKEYRKLMTNYFKSLDESKIKIPELI